MMSKRRWLVVALILLGVVGGSLQWGHGRGERPRPVHAWYCPAPPVAC